MPILWQTKMSCCRQVLVGSLTPATTEPWPIITISWQQPAGQIKPKSKYPWWLEVLNWLSLWVLIFSVLALAASYAPDIYYWWFKADTQPIASLAATSPVGGEFAQGTDSEKQPDHQYLPPYNPSLPAGDWLIIPRVGVRTELLATAEPETALKEGVWLVPEYGRPGDDLPIILAAHRFGWKWWWQTDYWQYHSFYKLPELEPGDTVEMIVDHRKWVYEIYGGEQGEEITDYEADLILYTCKFLSSPIRHFRYARLIDPTINTQS